jgi:hypothetical protein
VHTPRIAALAAVLGGLPACGARSGLDVPPVVVHREDCAEAGLESIYVVTSQNELFSFDPQAGAFSPIGMLDCVDPTGSLPFSMAVDRHGHAYVVFNPSGNLFEVDTATAKCHPTGFVPGQNGFTTFGMGFSTIAGGPAEVLYVAESSYTVPSRGLASIDVGSFKLDVVAPFSPDPANAVELTGTGDGRLYGLFIDTHAVTAAVGEIDKNTGTVSNIAPFEPGLVIDSFAFAYWGGAFYVFHAAGNGPTTVTRFDPGAGPTQDVATLDNTVVGVGVSTCAPPQ